MQPDIQQQIEQNKKDGFVALSESPKGILGAFKPIVSSFAARQSPSSFYGTKTDPMHAGPFALGISKAFFEPTINVVKTEGMEGLGAVAWGDDNNLPAYIYKTSKVLPYTAQGLENQTNASVGMGAKYIYKYTIIANGIAKELTCDFHAAGTLLLSRIRDLRQLLSEEKAQQQQPAGDGSPVTNPVVVYDNSNAAPTPSSYRTKADPYQPQDPFAEIENDSIASTQSLLDQAIADYKEWFIADKEIREFEKNNDLNKVFNDLAQDDLALDLNFPLIGLEQGTKAQWEAAGEWYPKIVKISFTPAVISRFELKDERGIINHVYASERWRYHRTTLKNITGSTIAYPIIRWNNFHDDLQEKINKQLKKKSDKGWTAWMAVPNKHLSNELEYYTFPAWWSIYPSLAFNYATTLMLDKSIARNNDISFRRIIYVDRLYLEDLYAQDEKGQDKNRQKEIREELEAKVNNFLSQKSNNGKTLMVDSTVSADGKTLLDSIRVVTLPETSQKTTEDEIHAISSVLFYALGIDPRLVGAVPGKQNSSSGTQARELELLNQKKLVQRKARQKRLLLFIAEHNKWCPDHIDVAIQEQTLSTLDASKTGIVETAT